MPPNPPLGLYAATVEPAVGALVHPLLYGPHRHRPPLQIALAHRGFVLCDAHGAGRAVPVHLLAEELRHVPGGDEGPTVGDIRGHVHLHGLSVDVSSLAVHRHHNGDPGALQSHLLGGLVPAHVGAQRLRHRADGDHGAPVLDLRRHTIGNYQHTSIHIDCDSGRSRRGCRQRRDRKGRGHHHG